MSIKLIKTVYRNSITACVYEMKIYEGEQMNGDPVAKIKY